ncbi:MAG: hypothetical protein AABM33_00395 [Pseudomonadota bacterium]
MNARQIIEKFGGQTALAHALGTRQSTVSYWAKTGAVPVKWQTQVVDAAKAQGIVLTTSDFVVPTVSSLPASMKTTKNNELVPIQPSQLATPRTQGRLDLGIDRAIEVDGVGMGVLTDGTAFLTGRGLARLCGVAHRNIQDISTEFQAPEAFPRVARIREIMQSHGGSSLEQPYIAIQQRSGTFNAYPDSVCIAILEYYAFEATPTRPDAIKNYRLLAGKALRDFIYTQVGYDPNKNVPQTWKNFHDRVSLTYNSVPKGYFGIFKEIADMIVTLGQAGLHIDNTFVPDISVGIAWSKHWDSAKLAETFGERQKYQHNYPDYFPQSESNPQEPWCYPEAALGEFRRWFRESYIGEGKFQKYIEGKVKLNQLPVSFAQLAISAYVKD